MGIKNRKGFTGTSPNGVLVFCGEVGKSTKTNKCRKYLQVALVLEQVNKEK